MKRFSRLLLTFSAALASACGGSSGPVLSDFTTEIYTPAYASGFDIRGNGNNASTLVSIRNPWQGGTNVEQHLLILRDDAKAPCRLRRTGRKSSRAPRGVHVVEPRGDVRRHRTGQAYFGRLGHRLHLESLCPGTPFCGEVRDVGYDTNLNFELLAAMRPDLMLLYGVTGENTIVTGKLRELGIPYIYIGDYMEESPLGKAEWLVLAAELCDLRAAGADTLQRIARDYQALKAHPAPDAPRPKVMLNTPYRDTWFLPSSQSY